MKQGLTGIAAGLAMLGAASAAQAGTLPLSGSMSGFGFAGPDESCAPLPFRGTLMSTNGSGSLGDFTYGHEICLSGISGPSEGTFVFNFGADAFEGTVAGMATPSDTPGIADLIFNYTILGGTGRFLGASGTFTGAGTSDGRERPPLLNLAFGGSINAPAVPEPGTWLTMIVGFGIAGLSSRYRRTMPIRLT